MQTNSTTSEPQPLETTHPYLAQSLQAIVHQQHRVTSMNITPHGVRLFFDNTSKVVLRAERNEPCRCGSGKKYKKCCGGNPIRF